MFWKISIPAVGLWVTALSAQTAPPPQILIPQPPAAGAKIDAALRELLKQRSQPSGPLVCSIPLLAVTIDKKVDPMPQFRPPFGFDISDNIDRMPVVKLPAPPCPEEKR
ncbi:MAG: hypothetical protein ABSH50_23800 [Bryobacteraceae bacterium]|jgi:hypothetical protein